MTTRYITPRYTTIRAILGGLLALGLLVIGQLVLADAAAAQVLPSVEIEVSTNGQDSDTAPGPGILVGDAVTWAYVITNTGTTSLVDIVVTDDQLASSDISCDAGSNIVAGPMLPGEVFSCVATGTAFSGLYANTGDVSAAPSDTSGNPLGLPVEIDQDPSHYHGLDPAIDLEVATNGQDSDSPLSAQPLGIGDAITWSYVVTNNGNADLIDLFVFDDQGLPVSCPSSGSNYIPFFPAGASETCASSGGAEVGLYANLGLVEAQPVTDLGDPIGSFVTADDPSHYFGLAQPHINLANLVNGQDANSLASAASVNVGSNVIFHYVVTNTGNVDLSPVVITDDQGMTFTCPSGTNIINVLSVGETVTCTAASVAIAGFYTNIGDAQGTPVDANGDRVLDIGGQPLPDVFDDDPANYFGGEAAINIEKSTNGVQADLPADAVTLRVGDTVFWDYVVTNTGNLDLVNVVVTDNDPAVNVACPSGNPMPQLAVGSVAVCTAIGTAVAGLYSNTGTAEGVAANGDTVQDADDSHYIGVPEPLGAIGDLVWFDDDGDGLLDPSEPGIAGVALDLLDASGLLVGATITDAAGLYLFTDVPAGSYSVAIDPTTLPAGLTPTFDADGGLDNTSTLTLSPGENNLEQDFGYAFPDPLFAIGDYVWLDDNADGVQDAAEPGIPGVELTLADASGLLVGTTTTDAAGQYLFTNVPAGSYSVAIDPATLPAGVVQTYDADGGLDNMSSTTIAGASDLEQDFGYGSAPQFPVAVDIVTLAGRSDGWVQVGGTRNWVSAVCRSRLVAAGAVVTEVAWPTLAVLVDAVPFQRCDGLLQDLFAPRIVTLTGRTDGWVQVGGTRNWVSTVCRAQLVANGAIVQEVSWPTLDALVDATPFQRCDGLIADLFDDAVQLVTLANRSDGWLIVGPTRNWVSADCRTELVAAGALLRVVDWPTLSVLGDAVPFERCPALLQSLFNQ